MRRMKAKPELDVDIDEAADAVRDIASLRAEALEYLADAVRREEAAPLDTKELFRVLEIFRKSIVQDVVAQLKTTFSFAAIRELGATSPLGDIPSRKAREAVQSADPELVARVRRVFTTAARPDQAQSVTFLVRALGAASDDVKTVLQALVAEGHIYARPHMRGHLYYLVGHGPGKARAK